MQGCRSPGRKGQRGWKRRTPSTSGSADKSAIPREWKYLSARSPSGWDSFQISRARAALALSSLSDRGAGASINRFLGYVLALSNRPRLCSSVRTSRQLQPAKHVTIRRGTETGPRPGADRHGRAPATVSSATLSGAIQVLSPAKGAAGAIARPSMVPTRPSTIASIAGPNALGSRRIAARTA
jgi:hypothetical protein